MRKWEKEELEISVKLLKDGFTYKEIGEELKRTPKSIKLKLNRNGYKFENYSNKRYYENKKCLNCDKELKVLKSENRKFCDHKCSATFNNKLRDKKEKEYKKCLNCDEKLSRNDKIYCNNICQHEHQWEKKKILIENGDIKNNQTLRKYKIEKDGHKCNICKKTKWEGDEIPLVLDHIDGDPYNNLPENLRMICPNCDAQTETYKGKNTGKGRQERMKRYYEGKSY
jgi:hypothetical protein